MRLCMKRLLIIITAFLIPAFLGSHFGSLIVKELGIKKACPKTG